MNYSVKISNLFSNLSNLFVGEYDHSDKTLNDLRKEMLDIDETPTTISDKHHLKADLNSFLRDTKVAASKIKEEIKNG